MKAVVLAAGIAISAVALAFTNALKSATKTVGKKNLKAIGKKAGSILPGLIGSIVGFIFKLLDRLSPFLVKTLGC